MGFTVVCSPVSPGYAAAAKTLTDAGVTVRTLPADAGEWTPELIAEYAPTADAWLGTFMRMKLPRAVLDHAPKTRVIVSNVIGTEGIDVAAASELGILVANGAMPENFEGMAEAGVLLIAALRKGLAFKISALRQGQFGMLPGGKMVRGATIGILGLGRIGRSVARRLQGWDCDIIAHDPYLDAAVAAEVGVELSSLDDVLARSDVLVVLLTLSEETRHMINADTIAKMKPGASLVNIGRGGCVDEAALLAALDSGHLSGAALDTWEQEPPSPDNPLVTHSRVIATGHIIGHSDELYALIPKVAAEQVLMGLKGVEPPYIRNPDVLPRWHERIAQINQQTSQTPRASASMR